MCALYENMSVSNYYYSKHVSNHRPKSWERYILLDNVICIHYKTFSVWGIRQHKASPVCKIRHQSNTQYHLRKNGFIFLFTKYIYSSSSPYIYIYSPLLPGHLCSYQQLPAALHDFLLNNLITVSLLTQTWSSRRVPGQQASPAFSQSCSLSSHVESVAHETRLLSE